MGKAASRLWVDGAGHLSLQDLELSPPAEAGFRNGPEQRTGIGVGGIRKQFPLRGPLYALAHVHDHDLVGDVLDYAQVVGDEHIGQSPLVLEVHQ